MPITEPYMNYMGEWPAETGPGSVLEYVQNNHWDTNGDGTGDVPAGFWYYNTSTTSYRFAEAGGTWQTVLPHAAQHENGGSDEIDVSGLSGELSDDQPAKAHDLGGARHTSTTLSALNALVSDATLDDSGDPRDPNAHASSHENGGGDEISVAGLSGTLADPQTPTSHASSHENGGGDEINVAGLSGELADDQPPKAHALGGAAHSADTLANLNTKISDATLDDSGDPRDPNAHASSHENGGGDELSVAGLSGTLADPQTPSAHATSHENGGADELDVSGLSGELADPQPPKSHALGGTAHTADTLANLNAKISDAILDDSGDPRDPNAHASSHENGGGDEISVAGLSGTLADPQTPTSHASSHENGGADEISVAGLSGTLADEQDAGSLKGDALVFSSLRMGCKVYWDANTNEWKNEPLPVVPYARVLGADWAPTWTQLNAFGHAVFFNTVISVTSHVGNATVATLNAMSATAGDSYTVTDSGTLTAGSLAVAAGAIVYWTGTVWAFVVPHDGSGYVRSGVRVQLSTTTALISPYTDGVDDGKIFAFEGTDNTGIETTEDLTFTLPDPSGLPNDGMFRGPIYVGNFGGEHALTVDIASAGTFSDGLASVLLEYDSESIMLGVVNGGLATTWMRISNIRDSLQVRRAATWGAANFSTPTPVPFDTEDHAGNSDVSYWDNPTNPSRVVMPFKSVHVVSGSANINSTGGVTWICECWLRKNGTTEILGSRLRTGNYGNEDQSVTLPPMLVKLDAGDYLEWIFDHASLSGNLNSAMLTVQKDY